MKKERAKDVIMNGMRGRITPQNNPVQETKTTSTSTTSISENALHGDSIFGLESEKQEEAAFALLPEDEKHILKTQLDSPSVKVTFFTLYRYADPWDYVIIAVSAICAIAAGAALPLFAVLSPSPTKQTSRACLQSHLIFIHLTDPKQVV